MLTRFLAAFAGVLRSASCCLIDGASRACCFFDPTNPAARVAMHRPPSCLRICHSSTKCSTHASGMVAVVTRNRLHRLYRLTCTHLHMGSLTTKADFPYCKVRELILAGMSNFECFSGWSGAGSGPLRPPRDAVIPPAPQGCQVATAPPEASSPPGSSDKRVHSITCMVYQLSLGVSLEV
jgi:hypothetical protein